MSAGPWSVSVAGPGLPVVFDKFLPERSYALWFGTIRVKDKANLDWLTAQLNRKTMLTRRTRAQRGSARRRALLAKVRERTRVIGKLCCRYGEAARLDEAPGASWECPMHFNGT